MKWHYRVRVRPSAASALVDSRQTVGWQSNVADDAKVTLWLTEARLLNLRPLRSGSCLSARAETAEGPGAQGGTRPYKKSRAGRRRGARSISIRARSGGEGEAEWRGGGDAAAAAGRPNCTAPSTHARLIGVLAAPVSKKGQASALPSPFFFRLLLARLLLLAISSVMLVQTWAPVRMRMVHYVLRACAVDRLILGPRVSPFLRNQRSGPDPTFSSLVCSCRLAEWVVWTSCRRPRRHTRVAHVCYSP